MKKIVVKIVVLIVLTATLVILFSNHPISNYEKVKIVEKYYTPKSNGTAKGITTKKSVPVPSAQKGEAACAMEFSNGKVLELDCDFYLNYSVGEKVKIKYEDKQLSDIRRK